MYRAFVFLAFLAAPAFAADESALGASHFNAGHPAMMDEHKAWFACQKDADCLIVPVGCGHDLSVNSDYRVAARGQAHDDKLDVCAKAPAEPAITARCIQRQCVVAY